MSVSLEGDEDKPSVALVVGVMLVATLEVLDVTVVNIALPHIMGSFGATPDQVTWMITSYLIATVIVMPLTGYFVSRYGRQRTMLVGVVGFTITSLACGLSWSLTSMVVFRFLQGAFGAVLVPISQSILLDAYPREKANQASATRSSNYTRGSKALDDMRKTRYKDLTERANQGKPTENQFNLMNI